MSATRVRRAKNKPMAAIFDLSSVKHAYLIGIKGTAMEALAEIFTARGIQVTGSDVSDIFYTDELLNDMGIRAHIGFDQNHIPPNADLIVHSTAYTAENNPEVAFAKSRDLPVISYPEALSMLFAGHIGIAVTGTHGKTTTTAMLGEILRKEELSPTVLVGSKVMNWGRSTLAGSGVHFIAEADEYQNKLRFYQPHGVVVTNIDYDHPDFFKTEEEYAGVFKEFFLKIPRAGFLVYNINDSKSAALADSLQCRTVSFGEGDADFVLLSRNATSMGQVFRFGARSDGKEYECMLQLSGRHNAVNALAAIAAAAELGVAISASITSLAGFKSSERRFQEMGRTENGGVLFDDYAHHPEEIKATLKGARERFPDKKIIAAFHPHTFSRTKALFDSFAQAFGLADVVYILDIYASARENASAADVHSRDLVERIKQNGVDAEYVPTIADLAPIIAREMDKDTVFISMGAGDIWKIHGEIKKKGF